MRKKNPPGGSRTRTIAVIQIINRSTARVPDETMDQPTPPLPVSRLGTFGNGCGIAGALLYGLLLLYKRAGGEK